MQHPSLTWLAVAAMLCFVPATLPAQGTGLMFNISGGTINGGINLGATSFVGANPFAASGSLSGGISNNPGMTAFLTGNTGAQIGFGTNLFNPPASTLTANAGTGFSAGASGGTNFNPGSSQLGTSAGGALASDQAALRALFQEQAQLVAGGASASELAVVNSEIAADRAQLSADAEATMAGQSSLSADNAALAALLQEKAQFQASRGAGRQISALNRQIQAERAQLRADRSQLVANEESQVAGGATVSSDAASLAALFRQREQLEATGASAFQLENVDSQIAVDRDQLQGDLESQTMAGGGMPASAGAVFHGRAAFGGGK